MEIVEQRVEEEQRPQNDINNPYNYVQEQGIYPSQDQGFLKWLFSFRKEAVEPLRHTWRGEEYDFNTRKWKSTDNPIMNEKGITWAISLIESYMNPAFIVTDLDEKTYNFRMRECVRVIWNSLTKRWVEFGINDKTDIHRIAEEIESKICAILRGALNDGYRAFFSTQNQNIETKNLSPMQDQRRPGVFSSMAKMFKRQDQQQQF